MHHSCVSSLYLDKSRGLAVLIFRGKRGWFCLPAGFETRFLGHKKETGHIPRVFQIRFVNRVIIVTIGHTALLVKFGGLKRGKDTVKEQVAHNETGDH